MDYSVGFSCVMMSPMLQCNRVQMVSSVSIPTIFPSRMYCILHSPIIFSLRSLYVLYPACFNACNTSILYVNTYYSSSGFSCCITSHMQQFSIVQMVSSVSIPTILPCRICCIVRSPIIFCMRSWYVLYPAFFSACNTSILYLNIAFSLSFFSYFTILLYCDKCAIVHKKMTTKLCIIPLALYPLCSV